MKMEMRFLLATILLFATLNANSQTTGLYQSAELQEAYKNKTRSQDGLPGPNYFQNHADYTIDVDFDPVTGRLKGSEKVVYYNESPDTLSKLVVRLYMDIFKKGVERDFSIGSKDLHNGVEISNVSIDGQSIDPKGKAVRHRSTNMFITLSEKLAPGDNLTLKMDWQVPMPKHISIRFGRYGKDNWFIAYWYPQIAVYDDITGWDTHPFTGSAEFYNDFNNYNISVNVPQGYRVWATGVLKNERKHYTKKIRKRLKKARNSDSVIHVVKKEDLADKSVLSGNAPWRYQAEETPDFAFAVSRTYLWDATSVKVENNRRVFVDAAYREDSKDFHKVAKIAAKTIKLFSNKIMGAAFPYPTLTAFNGSGGMEFPMIINDGDAHNLKGTVHVTAHEIGHNYFPFHVMTNESYYAFMDEGLVSFLPREVEKHFIDDYNPFAGLFQSYASESASFRQVPLMVKSYMISDYSAYRTHAYTRPAAAFYFLRDMVGEEKFTAVMRAYIDSWKKKHPTPYDFFNTVERVTGRNLDWYWNPWFFELGYPDLAVDGIRKSPKGKLLVVKRKGKLPVPVKLQVQFTNGETLRKDIPASVWKDGGMEHLIEIPNDKEIDYVLLGGMAVPDAFPKDNIWQK